MVKQIVVFVTLIVLGMGLSGYLLARHFTLSVTAGPVAPSTCSVLLKRDCDGALRSDLSQRYGLPLAGWGVVYYGTMAALMACGWFLGDGFRVEAALIATVLAAIGAGLSIALFAAMVSGLAPFCPLCAGTHAINILLLPVCLGLTGHSVRGAVRAIVTGVGSVLSGETASTASGRLKLVGGFGAALVGAGLYQWVFIQEKLHPPAEFDVNRAVAAFAISPRTDIPVRDDDPRLGPDGAWVRVVVFTDFQCQGCRRLATTMGAIVERYRPRVQVVFKNFPVSKSCNSAVKDDPHPQACEAAWAADAARRQGKFWPYHDALFATARDFDQAVPDLAREAGLEPALFQADRLGDDVRARVRADIELGLLLGVDETPTVFLNGRRAPDVRPQSLDLFVVSEIASRSHLPLTPRAGADSPRGAK